AARSRLVADETSDAIRASYLDVGRDGDGVGILMPDRTGVLFDWEEPISVEALDRVLAGLARLHAPSWTDNPAIGTDDGAQSRWCPIRERITLICRSSLQRPGPAHDAVADRLLPGWDAFHR